MQIFVDADACPVVDIVETIAEKYNIPTTLLCDTNHVLYSDYSEVIVVGAGADAVDYKLISICHKGDIVVSQDYGVAAMALGKGAYAIHQSGKWYTNENIDQMLRMLNDYLLFDLKEQYGQVRFRDENNLVQVMKDVYSYTKHPFVILIDEWDCLFREYQQDQEAQKKYLDFLRFWLKDKEYVALAYMTGILPIKKYGTHSALNMFDEFSMIDPGPLAKYVGFTEEEVSELCERYGMDMQELKSWYDGYSFEGAPSVYSPRSVVSCMRFGKFGNYWNQTETFEALKMYIDMNFEGLRDDVLSMIAGEKVPVNTGSFTNDMTTFRTEDDVLTLLIHLGYLGYDSNEKCVFIPNNEIRSEYVNAVSVSDWGEV